MDRREVDIEKVQNSNPKTCKNNYSNFNVPRTDQHSTQLTIIKVKDDSKILYNEQHFEVQNKKIKLEVGINKINKPVYKPENYSDSHMYQTERQQKTILPNNLTSIKKENKLIVPENENHSFKEDQTNKTISISCQTVKCPILCIANLKNNEKAIEFYTGLQSYEKLLYVFESLGSDAYDLQYYYYEQPNLETLDQFFMTLILLRQHKSHFETSILFDITLKDIKNIFITWIRFMKLEWSNLKLPTSDVFNAQLRYIDVINNSKEKGVSLKIFKDVDGKFVDIENHKNKSFKKVYKILNGPQNYIETHLMNDIIFICHVLCYFKARRIPLKEDVKVLN